MIIGLENPSEGTDQIITSGQTGAEVVRKIDSDYVKLNYDFGNAFTYSKGAVDPAIDYKKALPFACYLHLKDINKINGGWDFAQIGQGIVNYDIILQELAAEKKMLPMSIEHLFIYSATQDLVVQRNAQAPELSQISKSLKASYDYVQKFIAG
jgi:sugar phosphate isomerase/epimerase